VEVVVIDTETHVFLFARDSRVHSESSKTKHFTWHEHDGALLVDEMDAAGVDKTVLISYDAEDIRFSEEHMGFDLGDFAGGRKYTRMQVEKFPERFYWVSTLKNACEVDVHRQIDMDLQNGAQGFKLFPAYVQADLSSAEWCEVFAHLDERGTSLFVSFETLRPPETFDLATYYQQLARALTFAPTLSIALMHGGCEDPIAPGPKVVPDFCTKHPSVMLSMAMPGAVWDDGTEYPYPRLLKRVLTLKDSVGPHRIMWATDWPWFSDRFIYGQGIDCFRRHANFFTADELSMFLGQNAEVFMNHETRG
jgi:predicted TIM-barrel fold metal-dependent hydrolase